MQSSSQRIVKNTMLLYIRQLFTLALGLYTTTLILRLLGVTDYGIYAAVGGVTWLLNILSSMFSAGSHRFLTIELAKKDIQRVNRVYISSVHLHLIVAGILIIIGETIGVWFLMNKMTIPEERLNTAFWVFQISLLSNVSYLMNVPNEAVLKAHENFGFLALMSVIVSVLKCLAVVLLFSLSWDKLILFSLAFFIIQFLNRFINTWYCKKHYQEAHYRFICDIPLMKSMLTMSFWLWIYGVATTAFLHGVTILLNIFFGPVLNAAYAVASQVYSGFRMFCSQFQSASNTQIVRLFASGELERMGRLLCSVCKISFFLIFALSLPFIVNVDYVLGIWLGDVPDHAASFFVLLIIYAYSDVFVLPLDRACVATGKVKKYSIVTTILLLLVLLISYLFYLQGSIPETIIIIAIVISWVGFASRIAMLKKLIMLDDTMFYKFLVKKIFVVSLLSLPIPLFMRYYFAPNIFSFIMGAIITYVATVSIIFIFGLDEKERMMVQNLVQSGRKKIFHKNGDFLL